MAFLKKHTSHFEVGRVRQDEITRKVNPSLDLGQEGMPKSVYGFIIHYFHLISKSLGSILVNSECFFTTP